MPLWLNTPQKRPHMVKKTVFKFTDSTESTALKLHVHGKKPSTAYQFQAASPEIRNLAFSGGGAKGHVYLGAVKYLTETAQLKKIKTVTGSSAGAIMSLLVAAGLSYTEIASALENDLHPSKIQLKDGSSMRYALNTVVRARLKRFFAEQSEITDAKLLAIQSKSADNTEADITFADLDYLQAQFPAQFKKLLVTATDTIEKKLVTLSSDTTPHVSLASAVRASSALPLIFDPETIMIDGAQKKLIDGGVWDNLPFALVNGRQFRDDVAIGHRDDFGQNNQTLCLALGDATQRDSILHHPDKTPCLAWQLCYFIDNLATNMPYGKLDQDMWFRLENLHSHRTIVIDPINTGTTEFNLSAKKKAEMIKSGSDALEEYDLLHRDEQIIYEYDSLFEMMIGLDNTNYQKLLNKILTLNNSHQLELCRKEYAAAYAIRKLLFSTTENKATLIDQINELLTEAQHDLINRDQPGAQKKVVAMQAKLEQLFAPITQHLTDNKNKDKFKYAVLSKINYECHGKLAQVSHLLAENNYPVSFNFHQQEKFSSLLQQTKTLFAKIQHKHRSGWGNIDNNALLMQVETLLHHRSSSIEGLHEVLNKIIHGYQRRLFTFLTPFCKSDSVIEALRLKEALHSLSTTPRPQGKLA